MNRTLKTVLKATLVVVLGGLVSCGDEKPPASQTQVVSKKIFSDPAKATTAAKDDVGEKMEGGALQAKSKPVTPEGERSANQPAVGPSPKGEVTPMKADAGTSDSEAKPVTSDLIKASLEMASTYDAKGRIDPFNPLFTDEPQQPVVSVGTSRKKRRTPQTPLEKVALSQLKLTAIMRMPQGNRALVEDASGKGYVVKKGTYMGLNAGQVIRIDQDRVLVEEEIQNMVGEYIINNTELKLQKTAGDQ